MLWTALLAGTVTVWVAGAASVPYVLGALVLLGLVCGLTTAYAQRLGVGLSSVRVLRWRLLPYVATLAVLLAVLLAGVLRADVRNGSDSFARGLVAGAVVGIAVAALAAWRGARA